MQKAYCAPWVGCATKKRIEVLDSLMKVTKWTSTRWWQSLHTRMMKEDPENRTRWKHKREWHKWVNVWDKMATWLGSVRKTG